MALKPDRAELERLLSCYIDGECTAAERLIVEEALRGDPALRALHEHLRRTVEAVRGIGSEPVAARVRERILTQLERRALLGDVRKTAGRSAARRYYPSLIAAGLLVAVGVGFWTYRMSLERPERALPAPPGALARKAPEAGPLGQGVVDKQLRDELAMADRAAPAPPGAVEPFERVGGQAARPVGAAPAAPGPVPSAAPTAALERAPEAEPAQTDSHFMGAAPAVRVGGSPPVPFAAVAQPGDTDQGASAEGFAAAEGPVLLEEKTRFAASDVFAQLPPSRPTLVLRVVTPRPDAGAAIQASRAAVDRLGGRVVRVTPKADSTVMIGAVSPQRERALIRSMEDLPAVAEVHSVVASAASSIAREAAGVLAWHEFLREAPWLSLRPAWQQVAPAGGSGERTGSQEARLAEGRPPMARQAVRAQDAAGPQQRVEGFEFDRAGSAGGGESNALVRGEVGGVVPVASAGAPGTATTTEPGARMGVPTAGPVERSPVLEASRGRLYVEPMPAPPAGVAPAGLGVLPGAAEPDLPVVIIVEPAAAP